MFLSLRSTHGFFSSHTTQEQTGSSSCFIRMLLSICFRKGFLWLVLLFQLLLEDTPTSLGKVLGDTCQSCSSLASSCMPQWAWVCKSFPPFNCQYRAAEGRCLCWRSEDSRLWEANLTSPTCWLVRDLAQNRPHDLHPRSP